MGLINAIKPCRVAFHDVRARRRSTTDRHSPAPAREKGFDAYGEPRRRILRNLDEPIASMSE